MFVSLRGMVTQVLHGCRQLVPWGVPLSGETSATLVLCYIFHRRLPCFAGRKERRTSNQHGPYVLGYTHPTMAKNNELQARESKLISEISPQFRSQSAIRLREGGIGSNRGSAWPRWIRSRVLYTPPVKAAKSVAIEPRIRGGDRDRWWSL